jgi:hypothetical protein
MSHTVQTIVHSGGQKSSDAEVMSKTVQIIVHSGGKKKIVTTTSTCRSQ